MSTVSNNSWGFYVRQYEEASNFMNATEQYVDPVTTALASGDYNAIETAIGNLEGQLNDPEYRTKYPDLNTAAAQQFLTGLASVVNNQILTQFTVSVQGQVVGNLSVAPNTSESIVYFSQDYQWDQVSDLEKYGIAGAPNDSAFLGALTNAINGSGGDPTLPAGTGDGLSWSIEGYEHYVDQGQDTDVRVTVRASGTLGEMASVPGLVTVSGNASAAAAALTAFINTY